MSLFKFLNRPSKSFIATNALEDAIHADVHNLDPRSFFELFATRTLIVLAAEKNGNRVSLEVSAPMKEGQLAFVYTSEEALEFAIKKGHGQDRSFIKIQGSDLFNMLSSTGLGMNINPNVGPPILCSPENIEHIINQLAHPPEINLSRTVAKEPVKLRVGIPTQAPKLSLDAMVLFLKNHPRFSRLALIFCFQRETRETSFLLYIQTSEPRSPGIDDELKHLGQIFVDVDDPVTKGIPFKFKFVDDDQFSNMQGSMILVTKNGYREA